MAMLNDPVPRIVADTANAIVNFLDEADGPSMAPYLDELVTKLLLVLQHSHLKFVNEEVCLPRLPKSSIFYIFVRVTKVTIPLSPVRVLFH